MTASQIVAAGETATAGNAPGLGTFEPRAGILDVPGEVTLHFGGRLSDVRIAWRLTGPTRAPVVLALGGISAGRNVAGDEPPGWWNAVIGPGKAIDTGHWQILGLDFLGGSGATTGPRAGEAQFPTISAFDQAWMLQQVLQHLGIARLHAIVGASYGGMVALACAERWSQSVARVIAISAADRTHPMSTAWRSVQRAMVRYALQHNEGGEGLRLARALAMATYRSPAEFAARFDAPPTLVDGRFQFPVEQYLLARGDAYVTSHVPESFVCLSESIDLHRIDPAAISVPTTLIAVREDQIVPLADMHALRARLAGPSELFELSSPFGHDAFLKEVDALRPLLERALA
jgi:homoserine O-acetyltransferase